jgi:hypothetical protein
MCSIDRVRGPVAFLFAGALALVACGHTNPPRPPNRLEGLQRALATALGDKFEYVRGRVGLDPNGYHFWLASIRAKRDGEFVLRCQLTYQFPPTMTMPHDDDATIKYHLVIAKAGTARVIAPGQYHSYIYPLACVGDTLVVPIPIEPNEIDHQFDFPDERLSEDEGEFGILKEIGGRYRAIKPTGGIIPLTNQASDILAPVSIELHSGDSRAKDGPISHGYSGVFDLVGAGKCSLEIGLEKPIPSSYSGPLTVAVDVAPKNGPLTVTVVSRYVQKYRMYQGRQVSSAQSEWIIPETLALRVGDRVSLSCGRLDSTRLHRPTQYSSIIIKKKPIAVPEGSLKETSLP